MARTKSFAHLRETIDQDPERLRRIAHMKRAMLDAQRLAAMRERRGMTQRGVAETLAVSQANVSRIEHEDDLYLSTLRGYVEALGGTLDISARFPDGEVIKVG